MSFNRWLTIIFCLGISNPLNGQCGCNAKLSMYIAEQQYRQEKVSGETIGLYKIAFHCGVKDASSVLDAISCSAMIRDTPSLIFFLEYGMRIGLSAGDYRRLWEHLGHDMELPHLLNRFDTSAVISAYTHRLLPDKIAILEACALRDQEYRDAPEMDWSRQLQNDSANWKVLRDMVKMRGYLPTYTELGLEGSEHLELILYHMPLSELEWITHYVIEAETNFESNLGHTLLYQLDRIGMDAGVIYTITDDHQIVEYGPRTQMQNKMWCQTFGEWFDEQDPISGRYYFTPTDPTLPPEEINRVRALLCLDDLTSGLKRKPWVEVVGLKEFEHIFTLQKTK